MDILMQKFRVVINWLDEHILEVLAYFLIAFIPLYPKLPLFEAIPGYIVRVRLEDIVILVTGIIWLVQFFRKKITWKTPLTWVIAAYAVTGLLSTISAIYITQTVPAQMLHVGKTLLHYFRYLEYFFIFFLVVATIKSKKQFKIFFLIIVATLIALAVYGYGQRHWYWPVYSTMNREFSKGMRLYLTEHARVQSTFGGHYDLAAYIVVVLPIILAGFFVFKSKKVKAGLSVVFLAGLWLIVQTASRSSFLGFMVGSYTVIGILSLYQPTWWKKIWTFLKHTFLYSVIIGFFILQFGEDIYDRFLQTLKSYPEVHDEYHKFNKQRKEVVASATTYVLTSVFSDELLEKWRNATQVKPPENGISTDEVAQQVIVSSDTQPTPARPSDVFEDIPDVQLVATESADGVVTMERVEKPRTFSDAALRMGLSAGIRYDTLWPRAIAGFTRNPLLGSGYATLTKESTIQFTEAESTDNNFLRTLGETGALGFITFYGVVILAIKMAFVVLHRNDDDVFKRIFAIGFIASAIGLLINALYIDVFAASKVAFTFWALAGIVTAAYLSTWTKPTGATIVTGSTNSLANALAGIKKPASQSKNTEETQLTKKKFKNSKKSKKRQ